MTKGNSFLIFLFSDKFVNETLILRNSLISLIQLLFRWKIFFCGECFGIFGQFRKNCDRFCEHSQYFVVLMNLNKIKRYFEVHWFFFVLFKKNNPFYYNLLIGGFQTNAFSNFHLSFGTFDNDWITSGVWTLLGLCFGPLLSRLLELLDFTEF